MVEVPTPELPLPELLPLLLPELCEGWAAGDGVSATTTMLVMTWPPGSVVTRAEVNVVGAAALLLAALEGLLLLEEAPAGACEDDDGCCCCGVDDCCAAGSEDCWGCALEAAGVALVAGACCVV
jgi:hypothetical protein